jgi:hypothetical protein
MSREPNGTVQPVPENYFGVPDPVRAASKDFEQARRRHFDLREEHRLAVDAVSEAQAADAAAAKDAVQAGKKPPKSRASAAIEKAGELARTLDAARALAVEAENNYLNTCRAHREEWMEELDRFRDQMKAREAQAIEELTRARLDRYNAETAYREIEDLGDPSKIKNPTKANVYAVLNFRSIRKLDSEDERRLAEFAEGSPRRV